MPQNGEPIHLNRNTVITYAILKLIAALAAEVEFGEPFVNTKEARVIRLLLAKLGQPQLLTPIHIKTQRPIFWK